VRKIFFQFALGIHRGSGVFTLKLISDLRPLISDFADLRLLTSSLCALLLALSVSAQAQQQMKTFKVGWLESGTSDRGSSLNEIFLRRLAELGFVEGKNIAFEYRSADNKLDRLPALAHELVGLHIDVLLTSATPATMAAKNATKTIPIVFMQLAVDPVTAGFVNSLARPGGNITGLTNIAAELAGKRLEILKETVPKLSRVALMWEPKNSGSAQTWKESQLPAKELGLRLYSMEVSSADQFEGAFKDAIKARSDALAVTPMVLATNHRKQIVGLTAESRLPAIYYRDSFVESGGLMSYGADLVDHFRRAADFIEKILKGAKPTDLPVEQPKKFEFIINLKAAKQIGLVIPPNVLARADKVIR
jgi:putative ABC transport system substrate-binding protein